jgi:hypothetical protein
MTELLAMAVLAAIPVLLILGEIQHLRGIARELDEQEKLG